MRSSGDTVAYDWDACMRNGRFEEAWSVSDEVMRKRRGIPCWHLPRHLQYFWNGEPLDGKNVLIRCYHGLGDTIHFVRYTSLVKQVARKVIVWCQQSLIPLFAGISSIDLLIPLHDGAPDVQYEVDVEVMELPHVFRTTLNTIPDSVPYISVVPKDLPDDDCLNVGLVWSAGEWDQGRSIPFSLLDQLCQIPGIRWYILQQGPALAEMSQGFGILVEPDNLIEAAATIASLDLMISVDTMAAHLAGATGVPVWTMLQHKADWRWMEDRENSPWYPTMKLFRQSMDKEWQPVIHSVTKELNRLVYLKKDDVHIETCGVCWDCRGL